VTQGRCAVVDDADAHCAHAKAKGATIAAEPATHGYGEDDWRAAPTTLPSSRVFTGGSCSVSTGGVPTPNPDHLREDASTSPPWPTPCDLRMVRLYGDGPMGPSAIAEALSTTRHTTSRHLKVMREAGLVELPPISDEDGRRRSLELRGFWDGQLQATPKPCVAFAERLGRFLRS